MAKLVRVFELLEPLRERIAGGLPVFGTCAGMIMLADRIEDGASDQETLGGLDITVRRNAFGRQVDSFETDLDFSGLEEPVHAVFSRAPWVEAVGDGVEVLAAIPDETDAGAAAGRIVAVRQGPLMATSFHPEVGGDGRVHRMFVERTGGTAEDGRAFVATGMLINVLLAVDAPAHRGEDTSTDSLLACVLEGVDGLEAVAMRTDEPGRR